KSRRSWRASWRFRLASESEASCLSFMVSTVQGRLCLENGLLYLISEPLLKKISIAKREMNTRLKRALTGIRPSGNVHLGNYLGTIREALKLQEQYECFYFIADMHALTTTKDPRAIREQTLDIVACWVALGLDTERHLMYRQSDLPMVG